MNLKERATKLLADSVTGVFAAALAKVFILLKMEKSAEMAVKEYYQKTSKEIEIPEQNDCNHPDVEVTSAEEKSNG